VAERVAIEGLTGLSDDQAYRAMDFLLDALPEIASEVFDSVAHLLNLDLDIAFVVIRLIGGLLSRWPVRRCCFAASTPWPAPGRSTSTDWPVRANPGRHRRRHRQPHRTVPGRARRVPLAATTDAFSYR